MICHIAATITLEMLRIIKQGTWIYTYKMLTCVYRFRARTALYSEHLATGNIGYCKLFFKAGRNQKRPKDKDLYTLPT